MSDENIKKLYYELRLFIYEEKPFFNVEFLKLLDIFYDDYFGLK